MRLPFTFTLCLLACYATTPHAAADTPTAASPAATNPIHFRINATGDAVSSQYQNIDLVVPSASYDKKTLTLRVGFLNKGRQVMKDFGVLTAGDFTLVDTDTDSLARIPARKISQNLSVIAPAEGVSPGMTNAGEVTFDLPSTPSTSPSSSCELRVNGFAAVPVPLRPDAVFRPPAEVLPEFAIAQPGTLTSRHSLLGVIGIEIESITIARTGVTAQVAFINRAHRDLSFSTPLTGGSFFLMDAHRQQHSPSAVAASLQDAIGPPGGTWPAGARHGGWVRFSPPHPHAGEALALGFPGFGPLTLQFDPEKQNYTTAVLAPPEAGNPGPHPLVKEAAVFHDIARLWEKQNARLESRDYQGYLNALSEASGARQAHSDFLILVSRVPVKRIRYRLPREQSFAPTEKGKVSNVRVFMDYEIDGVTGTLTSALECDFAQTGKDDNSEAAWTITRSEFVKQIPFWLLGYTGVRTSKHFLLFYRPESVSSEKIGKASRQVDHAHRDLSKSKNFRLSNRYAAFFVDRADDFRILTGRDPNTINGAVPSLYQVEGDDFVVSSNGIYINDFSFLQPSNAFGVSDREKTITHELAHLVLAPDTRPYTPLWVVEGTAVHFAGQVNSFSRQTLRSSGLLSAISLSQMSRRISVAEPGSTLAGAGNLKYEYLYSGEAVSYLIRTFGEDAFFNFYRAFASYPPSEIRRLSESEIGARPGEKLKLPVLAHHLAAKLAAAHFGTSLEQLDAQIKAAIYRKTF